MYETLGLAPGATPEQIRSSYRALVKACHPDISGEAGDAVRLDAVVSAYRELSRRITNCLPFPGDRPHSSPSEGNRPSGRSHPTPGATAAERTNIAELCRMAADGRTASVRLFAVKQLGRSGRRTVYPSLRIALYDSETAVVCAAVEAVVRLDIRQAIGELGAVFMRGDLTVRRCVLSAIANARRPEVYRSVVFSALKDSDAMIRRAALGVFADIERETRGVS